MGVPEVEKVHLGQVLAGQWRKPDVSCFWKGHPIVFELQISYTFISEIVGRDMFYRDEGRFVIWVFAEPQPNRAAQIDEAYFNKRNLFVLDEEARAESVRRRKLVLTCYYAVPIFDEASGALLDEQRRTLGMFCTTT